MAGIQSEIVSKVLFESNPLKVCYSGQVLKGVVKLCLPSNALYRAIYVKIVGEGFYSWVDDVSDHEITGSTQHFVRRIDLIPVSDAGFDIPPGNTEYPFEFRLPPNLPTSYEGTYGHVRYTLALCLAPFDNSSGTTLDPIPDVETFTVIKPLDLNSNHEFAFPANASKSAHFNYGFSRLCLLFRWHRGYMKISGALPVRGYCSGQIMNLRLDVINDSGQGVRKFMVDFIKEITYNAKDGRKKTETVIMAQRKVKGVGGSEYYLQSKKINLTVPSVPPTSFQSDNDVCVFKYMLRVTAVTGLWLYEDPILEIPVTIGTCPITNETYQVANQSGRSIIHPSAPTEDLIASAPSESIVVSVPPTYEEAMQADTSDGHRFSPRYPAYSSSTSYSNEYFY